MAKVEALTRQLEDLRRDRRLPINLISGSNGAAATAGGGGGGPNAAQTLPPQATRELEKLRRELMVSGQNDETHLENNTVQHCFLILN